MQKQHKSSSEANWITFSHLAQGAILWDDEEIGRLSSDVGCSSDLQGAIPKEARYLRRIEIDSKLRGRGLGTLAMQEWEKALKQNGYRVIYLIPDNRKLVKFYQRLGYEVTKDISTRTSRKPSLMKKTLR